MNNKTISHPMPEYESLNCARCGCHAAFVEHIQFDEVETEATKLICYFCASDENAFNHAISRSSRATVVDAMLPYDEAEQYWERQAKSIRVTSNLNAITAAIKDST